MTKREIYYVEKSWRDTNGYECAKPVNGTEIVLFEERADAEAECDRFWREVERTLDVMHKSMVTEWERRVKEFDALAAAGLRDGAYRPRRPKRHGMRPDHAFMVQTAELRGRSV